MKGDCDALLIVTSPMSTRRKMRPAQKGIATCTSGAAQVSTDSDGRRDPLKGDCDLNTTLMNAFHRSGRKARPA